MKEVYEKQVELLLDVIEIALQDKRVALKGGTAINLFHRNFPRYSVDLDLCYLPLEDRKTTFLNIHAILKKVISDVENNFPYRVRPSCPLNGQKEAKLYVTNKDIEIKIEPNFTLRGSLFNPENKTLVEAAASHFRRETTIKCLSMADTYGGKLCAALDRQHPRDFFDVKYLFENEGITDEIKDSFLFYLISSNRPIDEILRPKRKDFSFEYEKQFKDMSQVTVSIDELRETRENLIKSIIEKLNDSDKEFLKSFVSGRPDWSLVKYPKIKDYPSIKWKLLNQEKMNPDAKRDYIERIDNLCEKY
mgnify:CR=1 FL=1